jgi:hypothetical protein
MAGNITREEFAEIALKLYEKYTGKTAEAGTMSFTDTGHMSCIRNSHRYLL